MNNQIEFEPKYNFPGNVLRQKARAIFLYATAVFLIMNALLSCKSNTASQSQDQNKIDSLSIAKDTLQSQFNAARIQIDNDATKSAILDSMIQRKDLEIAKLQKETGHLISNNKKLDNEIITDKKIIASLKNDMNENTKSYEERLSALQNDKNDLMRQRDSLLAKYNKILALGSVLHASNIQLTAVHIKRSGREKDTKRARRADELKINFDIDENRIAENGTKQLYLVIKDPSGNLLSDPASGSGSTTSSNGTKLNYTVLKEIPLVTNEPVKNITVEWKKENEYEKGTYSITIYNGGYRIGGGMVELR